MNPQRIIVHSIFLLCINFLINITSSQPVVTQCQNITQSIDASPQLFWKVSTPNNSASNHELAMVEYLYEMKSCTNYTFRVIDIPSSVQFIMVQAHSYLYNITLSETSLLGKTVKKISGINIGLVRLTDTTEDAIFKLSNENLFSVSVLIVVTSYGENAPIPGGCNLEFELKTSPFLKLNRSSHMIQVDAQPAKMSELWSSRFLLPCASNMLTYEHYQLYLPSGDFENETYFQGIRRMLTVNRIQENGKKVTNPTQPMLRQIYSAYLGTGSVYVLLVKTADGDYSAYVPIHTYACKPEYNGGTCVNHSIISFLISLSWGIIGGYLCFVGNKKSKVETTVMLGLLLGLILCVFIINYHNSEVRLKTSAFISIIIGITLAYILVCIIQHCDVGIGIIAFLIDATMMAILLVSALFYTPLADYSDFDDHGVFWVIFAMFTLLVLLILFCWTHTFDELPPAFVGAYAIVLFLEYFTHSNLRYIVINTVRRATVENFQYAIISPPYAIIDFVMVTIWGILTIIGIIVQPKKSFSTQNAQRRFYLRNINYPGYGGIDSPNDSNYNDNVFLSDNEQH